VKSAVSPPNHLTGDAGILKHCIAEREIDDALPPQLGRELITFSIIYDVLE